MSEAQAAPQAPATVTPTPSAPAQPAAAPAAQSNAQTQEPPKPAAPFGPDTDPGDGALPKWVKDRMEQAKRSGAREVLSAVGVDKAEDAKAAVVEAKAKAEAEKTAQQKAADEKARADALQTERDDLLKAVSLQAKAALSSLTPEQQTVVVDLAGESPAKQIATIEKLRPTWAKPAPKTEAKADTPAAPAEAPKPAPLPPPATTAAPAAAPGQPPPPPAPDHLAEWERRKAQDPFAAAGYYEKYKLAIVAAQTARDAKKPAS